MTEHYFTNNGDLKSETRLIQYTNPAKLKVIKLKEGLDFKTQAEKPYIEYIDYIKNNNVILDWYPKVQAMKSEEEQNGNNSVLIKEEQQLKKEHFAFIDWNSVYLELEQFKSEKSWYNLNVSKDKIIELFLVHNNWYKLYIPKEDLYLEKFSVFNRVYDIVISLLKKYCEKFYHYNVYTKLAKNFELQNSLSTDKPISSDNKLGKR